MRVPLPRAVSSVSTGTKTRRPSPGLETHRGGWNHMSVKDVRDRLWRELVSFGVSLVDAVPPYRYIEATLDERVTDERGRSFILLGGVRVEVDRETLEELVVGERLWVRYTRRHKAVNIDRIPS